MGKVIFQVRASDADHGNNSIITYSLVPSEYAAKFSIDASTGNITVVGNLDRENTREITLRINASDGTFTITSELFVIITDVNDNEPIFTSRWGRIRDFIHVISCTITFDQNFFLHEISIRCLFLYHVHVFRISVTGMPFLLLFLLHSAAVAAWCGIQRVDPQMIHFQIFYHLVRRSQFNPQTIFG